MKLLQIILSTVIWTGKILAASGAAPVSASATFALAKHGEYKAVTRRVIASSTGQSRRLCFFKCLQAAPCRQVCYEETAGQCVLEDASLVLEADRQTMPGAGNCTYYSKQVCSTTYLLPKHQRKFPLPAFDGDTVLDFAVKASHAAIVLFSTQASDAGLKYELVFNVGSRTIIRKCLQCATLKGVSSPDVIRQTEFRRFWLRYDRGTFKLGKYQEQAYLQYTNIPDEPVRFIGFGAYDTLQTWVVYHTCP